MLPAGAPLKLLKGPKNEKMQTPTSSYEMKDNSSKQPNQRKNIPQCPSGPTVIILILFFKIHLILSEKKKSLSSVFCLVLGTPAPLVLKACIKCARCVTWLCHQPLVRLRMGRRTSHPRQQGEGQGLLERTAGTWQSRKAQVARGTCNVPSM